LGRWLGRGSRHVDSPRERGLGARLDEAKAADAQGSRPLTIHASPFYLDVRAYLRAASGPPAWSVRLVRMQRLRDDLREQLDAAWIACQQRFEGWPGELAHAWRDYVSGVDCSELNELIDKHNQYYPIEAGLRMQWPSGRYILPDGVQFPLPRLTAEALLAELSADPI
jgi:hypothetical protein